MTPPADESELVRTLPPLAITQLLQRAEARLADLQAELGETRAEAAMVRDHAQRYFQAAYGPNYVYRAPETFGNPLERWIWAVAAGQPEMAHTCIADIERRCAERDTEEEARDV